MRITRALLAAGLGVISIAAALPVSASAAPSGKDLVTAAVSASKDAVPGIAPAGADGTAVYLDSAGRVIPMAKSPRGVSATTLIGCTPVSGRDNPHWSSPDVSGHGWWDKGNCSNNSANVNNCLYEFYTDNTWRQKACSGASTLAPGGGSGNRTTARATCNNTNLTSWRNHVDVDVIGEIDTGEQPYNQADVACEVN
jgi:hypothetical protein